MTGELSDRAARISAGLSDWPRRRVQLAELWQMLDSADPATRSFLHRRALLAEAIAELAAAEIILLPSPRSYDRTEQPALPHFVTLPVAAKPSDTGASTVWHPRLAWAADVRLTPRQRDVLRAINQWLFRHRGDLIVPLRERSLEILGNEKALDRLFPTGLFAPGRLTLDLLKAKRVAPPMHTVRVGDGDLLLVVENSDTFDSIVTALRDVPVRVAAVGWGAGAAFEASVLSVPVGQFTEIAYFGDLDQKGLRIPVNAGRLTASVGLPPVRPAAGLYDAMQQAGTPQPHTERMPSGELADWLHPRHRGWATDLMRHGQRVAQEAVGLHYLLAHQHWRIDLA